MKFFIVVVLLILGCEEKPEYIPQHPQVVRMVSANQEVQLPTKLWEELEAVYRPAIFDKAAVEDAGESKAKLESPKEFFSFHIYLKEKTPGVLVNRNGFDLTFPTAGGMLDFQEFVQQKRGSFYLGFRPDIELKEEDILKVFYFSNSKSVKLGGELHGAGCNKYMDLTEYFRGKVAKEGILLNTTEGRHAVLMAGTYFFATSLKGKLFLSQLTVRDSRFKKLMCSLK